MISGIGSRTASVHSRRNSIGVRPIRRSASSDPPFKKYKNYYKKGHNFLSPTIDGTSYGVGLGQKESGTFLELTPTRRHSCRDRSEVPHLLSPCSSVCRSDFNIGRRSSSYSSRRSSRSSPLGESISIQLENFDSETSDSCSIVEEISADDEAKLFSVRRRTDDAEMASYGSIAFQMQDATRDASGMYQFLSKILKILSRTIGATVILMIITMVAGVMLIMGIEYLYECPLEPNIPIYLLVGGSFGSLKFIWLLCRQIRSRRYEHIDDSLVEDGMEEIFSSISYQATDIGLTVFLAIWFGFGNYWVYRIYPPNFRMNIWQPNGWCSNVVYWFTVAQLLFVYSIAALLFSLCFFLVCGQRCLELFGDKYK